ncbi:CotH kinase family protein [Olsenella intestinalis]|uniref:CotH kinase family protein n=1 Tax=Olsenella intestinalis TaxID=2930083 RepID=UPI00200E2BD1|nr:CotH kinase family protein [Olsenella intestinalis]
MSRASRALVASALSAIVLAAAPALARAAESSGTAAPSPAEPSLEQPTDPSALADEASQQPSDQLPATLPDAPSDAPVSAPADPAGEKSLLPDSDATTGDATTGDAAPDASVTDGSSDAAGAVEAAAAATADKPAPTTPAATTADDAQKSAAAKADASKAAAPAVSPTADDAYYEEDEVVDLYRLYNPYSGEHFYTASAYERDVLAAIGWNDEGLAWKVPTKRGDSVYRLYNPFAGDHHYTLSAYERDSLVKVGWNYEGVAWLSASFGRLPVWRLYNPYVSIGTHHYTISRFEYESVVRAGWNGEAIGFYAVDPDHVLKDPTKDFSHGVASLTANVVAADGSSPQTLRSSIAHDALYLFLPSYADLTKVTLSAFDAAGRPIDLALSGNKTAFVSAEKSTPLDLTSLGATRTDESGLALFVKQGLSALDYIHNLFVMISANISSVFVNSNDPKQDRAYVEASPDHSAKASVAVNVVDKDGNAVYDKDELGNSKKLSSIKGRGNSTWGIGDKKPYQISLNKKADLLQSGNDDNANKKWILLANANDSSLLHNTIGLELARALGIDGAVESVPVDLFYDGEYRGSYLLVEKVEIKSGRIDIHDLESDIEKANPGVDFDSLPVKQSTNAYGKTFQYVEGVADPEDFTGGFLIEQDGAYYRGEKCWFETDDGVFVVKSPEFCSLNVMRFISEKMQEAIKNKQGGKFNMPSGYSYDIDTLSKAVAIHEFTKNIDAFYTSTYFYLDKGSKTFFCSPLWDFDACLGLRCDAGISGFGRYADISVPGVRAWHSDATTVERMKAVYRDVLAPLVRNVLLGGIDAEQGELRSVAYYADRIAASQRMNNVLYGLSFFRNMANPFESWEVCVEYLCKWMGWRADWLDAAFDNDQATYPAERPRSYNDFDYGFVFDLDYYLEKNPDVAAAYAGNPNDAIQHFVEYGMREGRVSCRNFDVNAYRARYADLRSAFGNDLRAYYEHYCTAGFFDGRIGWR